MSSPSAAPSPVLPANSPTPGVAQRVRFTKMHGAGNDFVVLDETQGRLNLSPAQYRLLGDRHFGVGADQILSVRPAPSPELDFEYVIHNADGGEVEQCGNGSRCFVRYVVDKRLTGKTAIRVQTKGGVIEPQLRPDGLVTVNMGAPIFELPRIPFNPVGLTARPLGHGQNWLLALDGVDNSAPLSIAVASMGNPHAMAVVPDVDAAPVATLGPAVQALPAFPQGVNVGFMQVQSRGEVRLRVYERGAGETLACGSGACAAVAMGIRLGLLDSPVTVHMRGGDLQIEWAGGDAPVLMSGPAATVYEGEIDLPAI